MKRRSFLKWLGVSAATVAAAPEALLDPERELWVPGARTFFDLGGARPVEDVFVGYNYTRPILSSDILESYVRDVLKEMRDNLALAESVNRDYSQQFEVGGTVHARLPQRYINEMETPLPQMMAQQRAREINQAEERYRLARVEKAAQQLRERVYGRRGGNKLVDLKVGEEYWLPAGARIRMTHEG